MSGSPSRRSWLGSLAGSELLISLMLACVAGVLIFLKIPGLDPATRYAYCIFDLAVALVVRHIPIGFEGGSSKSRPIICW